MAHISVGDVTPLDSYTATAGQTEFTVSFPFFTDGSLQVFKTAAGATPNDVTDLLTLTTDYTVTGAGNVEGATKKITLTTGAAINDVIKIRRNEPAARTADLQEQGDFLAETFNDEQDLVIMLIQQIEEQVGRSITKGVTGGSWDGQSTVISDVGDPVANQDAATKSYVVAEVLSQLQGAQNLGFTPPTVVTDLTLDAASNNSYFLSTRTVPRVVNLPQSPADGSYVRLYIGIGRGTINIDTQGDDVIFTNASRIDDLYTATATATGLLTDSDRDGSVDRQREFRPSTLTNQILLNVTTGQQAKITDNTENTISTASLAFTTGDQYRVAYDRFTFDDVDTAENPTPSFIGLTYNSANGYWFLETGGDGRGVLYNTAKEKHPRLGTPGLLEIDEAKSVEEAIVDLTTTLHRLTNDRIDGSRILVDQDAASATGDNVQGPVFIHYNLSAGRIVTLESQAGGVGYHVVNGTESGSHNLTLAPGTGVTHVTLIKSGSVTHNINSVSVPPGSSCKIRPIDATQWIIYDADAAVVKV